MFRRLPRPPLFPYTTLFRSSTRSFFISPDKTFIDYDSDITSFLCTDAARDILEEGGRKLDTDRKSTRLNSSHGSISYAVFCLKKKTVLRPVISAMNPGDERW